MIDIRADGDDVLIAIKAVPGSTRTRIVGPLGDRLKITVAAAPEKGKANAAICELLAERCGVVNRAVAVAEGATYPLKTVRITGVTVGQVRAALGI